MNPSGAPIVEDFRFSNPPLYNMFFEWWMIVGILFIAFLIYLVVRRGISLRRKAKAYEDRMAPKRDAIRDIKAAAEDYRRKNDLEKYCLELTMILRVFMERSLKMNFSKQTASEFLRTIQNFEIIDDTEKLWMNMMVQKCELAKFADEPVSNKDLGTFFQRSLMFFNELTSRLEARYQREQENLKKARKEAKKHAREAKKEHNRQIRAKEKQQAREEKELRRQQKQEETTAAS